MRKRMLSGIRDLWIVLFCLMERTLLQILLAVPVPVRIVLMGILGAKYLECLFCTSLSMTILTVVMTVFVATNIKKWNAEFQIIYAMARIRKRSRKKVYNFIQNKESTGSRKAARFFSQVMYHFWVYFGTFPVPEVEQITDTQKWNNDVPKQSQTWYNDCTKKERTGFSDTCVPICAQD